MSRGRLRFLRHEYRRVKYARVHQSDVRHLRLDQAELPEEVEIRAEPGRLVVSAAARPRAGWAAKAHAMRQREDDVPLDQPTATRFDETDWRW